MIKYYGNDINISAPSTISTDNDVVIIRFKDVAKCEKLDNKIVCVGKRW